jgi:hypothetical protein
VSGVGINRSSWDRSSGWFGSSRLLTVGSLGGSRVFARRTDNWNCGICRRLIALCFAHHERKNASTEEQGNSKQGEPDRGLRFVLVEGVGFSAHDLLIKPN